MSVSGSDPTALLVFARCAGLVARAPGFSHPSVPPMLRAGFAFGLACVVAPAIAPVHRLEPIAFTLALAANVAIGAAIGFGASLLYDGAYFAGRAIDDYVGVRGSVPTANVTSAQGFGRLWSVTFLAAFMLLDGWVPVVRGCAASFETITASGFPSSGDWMRYALALPATVLRAAFMVAAPAIAVAASLQLVLAAATRVVPRFASFTLAFPAVFAGVLIVTIVTVPLLAPAGAHPWLLVPWGAR